MFYCLLIINQTVKIHTGHIEMLVFENPNFQWKLTGTGRKSKTLAEPLGTLSNRTCQLTPEHSAERQNVC